MYLTEKNPILEHLVADFHQAIPSYHRIAEIAENCYIYFLFNLGVW